MVEVTTLDLVIIGLYLLFMLLVGVWFVKRIKNTDDYYVAGRTLGPVVLAATVCATIIGGSAMMGRAGIAYTTGFMAIATALPYMLGMFIFSGYAGRIQQVGEKYHIESIPSLFEYRFGKPAKCVLAAMVAFAMVGTVAAQVTATATIIKLLGGQVGISYEMGAFIATAIFIIYTAASGLFGVVYTDVVQFFMLIIFVYLMIPFSSLDYLGGFGSFWASLDKSYITPAIDGKILGDIVTYLVFTMAGAEMWQRAFAAKDKKSAKRGMFWGTAVYGVTIALLFLMGLAAQQILPNVVEEFGTADAVIPALAIKILPPRPDGAGPVRHPLRDDEHGGQLSAGLCPDGGQRPRQDLPPRHEGEARDPFLPHRLGGAGPGGTGHRPVYQECLRRAHVRLGLLRSGGRTARPGGSVLEESHQRRHHGRDAGGLRGHRGLEAGGRAHGSGCHRPRRHRLRRPAGGSQPGHIPEAPHCDGGSEISVRDGEARRSKRGSLPRAGVVRVRTRTLQRFFHRAPAPPPNKGRGRRSVKKRHGRFMPSGQAGPPGRRRCSPCSPSG